MNNLLFIFLSKFFSLLGKIPRRWAVTIAGILGAVWYALDRRHRDVTLNNLRIAFANSKGPPERKRIARAVFCNVMRIPFEIGWSLDVSEEELIRFYRILGLDHLQGSLKMGKGVLVLTLHIGNWELLPAVFLSKGIHSSIVYRPLDFKAADDFFYDYRSRFGVHPIPKKKSMRKILAALKMNECVGILLDQDSGFTAGVFADFFNQPACTNKGMALLAMKTKAPVLPLYLIRRKMGFEVHIGPEIPLIETGDKQNDIQKNTARYNKALENIVKKYPEQWLWMHKRWKTRPR